MAYSSIAQVPRRSQWEANSAPNQPYNCGPTSVSFLADFYRDATFGIEQTRDLVVLRNGDGTSAEEQAAMLRARGVPCSVQQPTMAQLKVILNTRPVVIGLRMADVPAAIRGHNFLGIHAVAGRENAVRDGISGVLIMDPNFGYGHTPDPTNGFRFYPDSVIARARSLSGEPVPWRRTVIPNAPKAGGAVTRTITIERYPVPRNCSTKGGALTGYRLNPPPLTKAGTFGPNSGFQTTALYTISPTPDGWPEGPYQLASNGYYAGYLLANSQINLGPVPTAPSGGGFTQADVDKARKDGAAAATKAAADVTAGLP